MRPSSLLLLVLLGWSALLPGQTGPPERYTLPRRVMPLAKILLNLTEAGAELTYRPDQIPPLAINVPGGRRTLEGWLTLVLRNTELTFERGEAGYVLFLDPDLLGRNFQVYGQVKDRDTGELLLGSVVQIPEKEQGVLTNEYGYFSIQTQGGRRRLRFSYVGYRPVELELLLRQDTLINVSLPPSAELPAIVVRAHPDSVGNFYLTETRTSIGHHEVSRLGGPGGEADPLRIARLLPGVETGADGLGGIFVRGSEAGHNLVLLDGVPVYNLNHAAGLFSIFSNQAIRRVDLYKEGIPARFGGRIGGVLDVHTKDGNLYEYQSSVGSSMLAAHFTSEGPIKPGESSFFVSGRYFWAGEVLRRFSETYKSSLGRQGRMNYQVHDVNFKLNQRISDKGRLYFSLYSGLDDYGNNAFETDTVTVLNPSGALFRYAAPRRRQEEVRWGNTVGALRYNHIFNDHFFGNFRLSYSDLLLNAVYERSDSLNELTNNVNRGDIFSGRYASDIRQFGLAFDGQLMLPRRAELRFGVEGNLHRFLPQLSSGKVPLSRQAPLEELGPDNVLHPIQISTYASFSGRLGWLHYRAGLRAQLWRSEVNFYDLSPRLLLAAPLGPNSSLRLTYDRTVQPVHLVSSTVIGLPTDLWVPATRNLPPATASQISTQFTQQLPPNWKFEMGVYYRDMKHLSSFSEGGRNGTWLDNLSTGGGFAKGMELTMSRTRGKLKGWLTYTLAESRRQFDQRINLGRPYTFRYGRQHSVKFVAIYDLSPQVSLSANWRWGSGAAYSLSLESFLLTDPAILGEEDAIETINLVNEKNGVIFPTNHRLDVNAHIQLSRPGRPGPKHVLDVGIYNLYNRHNPIYYDINTTYFARQSELIADRNFVQVYIAPITPTLAYHLYFGGPSNKENFFQ